jgi:hypothetical protein
MSQVLELEAGAQAGGAPARREGERGAQEVLASYSDEAEEEPPLGAYAALVGIYTAGLVGALRTVDHRDCREVTDISARDFLLLALATHKLSRLITKDRVTSPFRAPFARFEEATGAGEVKESPRGRGLQRALGELFT